MGSWVAVALGREGFAVALGVAVGLMNVGTKAVCGVAVGAARILENVGNGVGVADMVVEVGGGGVGAGSGVSGRAGAVGASWPQATTTATVNSAMAVVMVLAGFMSFLEGRDSPCYCRGMWNTPCLRAYLPECGLIALGVLGVGDGLIG